MREGECWYLAMCDKKEEEKTTHLVVTRCEERGMKRERERSDEERISDREREKWKGKK